MTPDDLRAQLPHTLFETHFGRLGPRYAGKVRDVYDRGDHLVMVTTDRVSAFDRILGTIPFKGQILTQMALHGFQTTKDIVPNHVLDSPDPNVIVGRKCRPFPVEFVVRGYVTGSLYRDLQSGVADAYELDFPKNPKRDQELEAPMLTPATKAEQGQHDQPTSRRAILKAGWMSERDFEKSQEIALALFARGQALAAERGLILVDTKYELGLDAHGSLLVIDEIHTPDSSRYWVRETYDQRFLSGQPQQMLDKENLRQWLIETRGFSGDGAPPVLEDDVRVMLSERYLQAFQRLLGRPFESRVGPVLSRIEASLQGAGIL